MQDEIEQATQNRRYCLWVTFKHFIRYNTKIKFIKFQLVNGIDYFTLSSDSIFPIISFSNFVNSSLTFPNLLDALSVLFSNDLK